MKIEGSLNGSKLKVAIVAARFNDFIVSRLVGGAHDCLNRHDVNPANVDEVWVPGAVLGPSFVAQLLTTITFVLKQQRASLTCLLKQKSRPFSVL
jgi:6,7-dimethyl-8-ribityllumazine synthase